MANPDKWKAQKEAARILLTEQKNKHQAEYLRASTGVVYTDGCQPAPGTHPAILLMENAFHEDQVRSGRHHKTVLDIYKHALEELDNIPDESEDN